jgi:hypothetical protein
MIVINPHPLDPTVARHMLMLSPVPEPLAIIDHADPDDPRRVQCFTLKNMDQRPDGIPQVEIGIAYLDDLVNKGAKVVHLFDLVNLGIRARVLESITDLDNQVLREIEHPREAPGEPAFGMEDLERKAARRCGEALHPYVTHTYQRGDLSTRVISRITVIMPARE